MEQAPYWMWTKPKPSLCTHQSLQLQAYDPTWEEQAFAEDASGALGGGEGYTWPPRSYSCSFCRREFRSAQALGGHMNVHRRDRARLKQSSPPDHHDHDQDDHLGFQYHNPNPNPDGGNIFLAPSWPPRVLSNNNFDDHSEDPQITILGDDCMKSDLSVSLSLVLHQSTHDTTVSSKGDEEEATRSCKKRRIMSGSDESSLPFFLKLNCPIKNLHDTDAAAAADDQLLDGFSPNTTLTDIDLELRLGDRPKVK